jgi:pimeloyl-ACP methyl ester carboxylesterase
MGGGGALDAALRRPSLKATIGNAPYLPSGSLATDRVPTLIYAMQNDTLVTPSRLTSLYNTVPGTTEKAYIEVAGAGHNYIGQPSTTLARTMIPWLKLFIDNDARYAQFLCPMGNRTGISQYRHTCPLITVPAQA